MSRAIPFLVLLATSCIPPNPPNKPVVSDKFCAIFYGDGGSTFSSGLNTIAESLRGDGWNVTLYQHTQAAKAETDAVASGATRFATVGHSFGSGAAVSYAQRLGIHNLPVASFVSLDGSEPSTPGGNFATARRITQPIPANVKAAYIVCNPGTPILNAWPCPRIDWGPATNVAIQNTTIFHAAIDDDHAVQQNVVTFVETMQ